MAKSLHEHAPAIACGLAAFAQCIQRQHAQGIEYVGATEPEGKGMFFEQIHAAGSIAGDLCIRRHMRIRRGMEDPDGRTAPDRSALVRFQQIVRILTTTVGQACAGAKAGIEAEIFYDFGPEELQIGLPVLNVPIWLTRLSCPTAGAAEGWLKLLPMTAPVSGWRRKASTT